MTYQSRVELPADVTSSYEVFVNGVPQKPGKDYEHVDRSLSFTRELKQEGRLGFWRWTPIFLGIAGTYRRDDWVDVVYEKNARRTVKTRLRISPVDPSKVSTPVPADVPRDGESICA